MKSKIFKLENFQNRNLPSTLFIELFHRHFSSENFVKMFHRNFSLKSQLKKNGNFRSQNVHTIFNEKFREKSRFFDLENFRRPISKFSNYGSNKPFRSKFCAKLCRIQRRRPWNQKQGAAVRLRGGNPRGRNF